MNEPTMQNRYSVASDKSAITAIPPAHARTSSSSVNGYESSGSFFMMPAPTIANRLSTSKLSQSSLNTGAGFGATASPNRLSASKF